MPEAIPPERLHALRRRERKIRALPGPQGGVLPRRLRARRRGARRARARPRPSRSPSCARRPAVSLYHRFENDLFGASSTGCASRAQVVVLPRTPAQRDELDARRRLHRPRATRSTRQSLIAYADLVVSAGRDDEPRGRRARHAGLDDVRGPARRGRRALIAEGRLRRIERAEDVALASAMPGPCRRARAGATRRCSWSCSLTPAQPVESGLNAEYNAAMRRRLRSAALPLHRHSAATARGRRGAGRARVLPRLPAALRQRSACRTATSSSSRRRLPWVVVLAPRRLRAASASSRSGGATSSQRDYIGDPPGGRAARRSRVAGFVALAQPVTVDVARRRRGRPVRSRPACWRCSSCCRCVLVGGARFLARTVYERPLRGFRARKDARRVLIVGAGDGGRLVLREITAQPASSA